ncbi:hypothetical protein PVK06_008003 [Gossypium arboreum]|uniref:Trimeric autotransporter adhesin YadA-like head domain-containing protein n=1 Tax=Gossypium arboreum TaxID=29729 RepID=A0ABR0QIU1_GOSAR|nr:hypothetical protein PVK06_008003 [Gossypium arboreum]
MPSNQWAGYALRSSAGFAANGLSVGPGAYGVSFGLGAHGTTVGLAARGATTGLDATGLSARYGTRQYRPPVGSGLSLGSFQLLGPTSVGQ